MRHEVVQHNVNITHSTKADASFKPLHVYRSMLLRLLSITVDDGAAAVPVLVDSCAVAVVGAVVVVVGWRH